jgi:hypothetical protein
MTISVRIEQRKQLKNGLRKNLENFIHYLRNKLLWWNITTLFVLSPVTQDIRKGSILVPIYYSYFFNISLTIPFICRWPTDLSKVVWWLMQNWLLKRSNPILHQYMIGCWLMGWNYGNLLETSGLCRSSFSHHKRCPYFMIITLREKHYWYNNFH